MAADVIWVRVERDRQICDEQTPGTVVFPGLAVTQVVDRLGEWTVTHVGSGERLSSYGSMCRSCADRVAAAAGGPDWIRPKVELIDDPRVAAVVWQIDRAVEYCTGDWS